MHDLIKILSNKIERSSTIISSESKKLFDRAIDKRISIGVTGFSGSGKSTFITSLIHQLKYSNQAQMTGFSPARDHKILDVTLQNIPDCPAFDYQGGIDALNSTPARWPKPTRFHSGSIINISYNRENFSKNILGPTANFRIEIRDYPGEWLLDLPLVKHNFSSWSQDAAALYDKNPRKQWNSELIARINALNPLEPLVEQEIDAIFKLYIDSLKQAKASKLTLIQPGRFLLPDGIEHPHFFPLFNLHNFSQQILEQANENSLYKQLSARYLHYVNDVVTPFMNDFFRQIDRQVILVDVLEALSAGEDAFDEMLISLSRIIDCYDFGQNNFFKHIFSPTVEKILFLASKPDRVHASQHENLRLLLNDIIIRVCPQSIRNSISIETESACSVRSTSQSDDFLKCKIGGQLFKLTHPPMPESIPTGQQWEIFKDWTPPMIDPPENLNLHTGQRLPSIRMDKVLKELIGDKF